MTRRKVRELAYEIATVNGIKHRFNKEKCLASQEWEQGFRKMHPEISLHVPEATSLNITKGFNKSAVDRFYDLMTGIDDVNQLTPDSIFNMDDVAYLLLRPSSLNHSREKVTCPPSICLRLSLILSGSDPSQIVGTVRRSDCDGLGRDTDSTGFGLLGFRTSQFYTACRSERRSHCVSCETGIRRSPAKEERTGGRHLDV